MTKKLFALIMIVILISNIFMAGVMADIKVNGDNLSNFARALQNSMDEIVSGDAYDEAEQEKIRIGFWERRMKFVKVTT